MLDIKSCFPKNLNGTRTNHTCELCGFEPKTKNKYREKQDHLVMKHFKQKVVNMFPQTRPYSCPAEGCIFTGKDKQALLRHYTGKHGILEKYLKEALAENGIKYSKSENGNKRKSTAKTPVNCGWIDPKHLLPKQPLPIIEKIHEEIKGLSTKCPISISLALDQRQHTFQQQQQQTANEVLNISLPIKVIELPQQQLFISVLSSLSQIDDCEDSQLGLELNSHHSTFKSDNEDDGNIEKMKPSNLSFLPLSLEQIPPQAKAAIPSPASLYSPITPVINNKEVMWGSGPSLTFETLDNIPITNIDSLDGNYNSLMDVIDCDLLMPSINGLQ